MNRQGSGPVYIALIHHPVYNKQHEVVRTCLTPLDLHDIARALPHVDPALIGHDMAYPAMLKFLRAGFMGLMIAGMLAAYVSTISTHLNWGTSYLVHDVYRRFVKHGASEAHYARWAGVDMQTARSYRGAVIERLKFPTIRVDVFQRVSDAVGVAVPQLRHLHRPLDLQDRIDAEESPRDRRGKPRMHVVEVVLGAREVAEVAFVAGPLVALVELGGDGVVAVGLVAALLEQGAAAVAHHPYAPEVVEREVPHGALRPQERCEHSLAPPDVVLHLGRCAVVKEPPLVEHPAALVAQRPDRVRLLARPPHQQDPLVLRLRGGHPLAELHQGSGGIHASLARLAARVEGRTGRRSASPPCHRQAAPSCVRRSPPARPNW